MPHPIHALWCHPRSMSTAIERVMRERGDLDCAHEPFLYDYYVHRKVRLFPMFDVEPDRPQSYQDIRDDLLARAEAGPVFIKEMSYYVLDQLLADAPFRARLKNAFLVRHPRASIPSFHKLDPDLTDEEVGYAAQVRHYRALTDAGETPPILISERVAADPRGEIGRLWAQWGLPHVDAAFDWTAPPPEDWGHVSGWHGDAINASGIERRPVDETARDAKFARLLRANPRLEPIYARHLPAYEALCAAADGAP